MTICAAAPATETASTATAPAHSHDHSHGHSHAPPHGGALVSLGGCFAHIEFVVDANEGRLTAYILDGNAERGVRLAQPDILATVTVLDPKPASDTTATISLKLVAQSSALSGEKPGDSSEFSAATDALKGARRLCGRLGPLSIKGEKFDGVEFEWSADEQCHDHGKVTKK
jgi:hypothetical protein